MLPVIDAAPLLTARADRRGMAAAIRSACRDLGLFYVIGHGVEEHLQERLERLIRTFFDLPVERKLQIRMERGGRGGGGGTAGRNVT